MNPFHTKDIILAAALKHLGYNVSNIEIVGTKGVFFFNDVPDNLVTDFDLGILKVEPVAFSNAIKSLTTATRRQLDN